MGRVVRRVAMGFEWPLNKIWVGYWFPFKSMDCPWCKGTGWDEQRRHMPYDQRRKWQEEQRDEGRKLEEAYCPHCDGEGSIWPSKEIERQANEYKTIDPPAGEGWQMWEDTSEGSPISPVFATQEELARWLADTKASAFGNMTATYEEWLRMIGQQWACSAVWDPANGLRSGVAASGASTNENKLDSAEK